MEFKYLCQGIIRKEKITYNIGFVYSYQGVIYEVSVFLLRLFKCFLSPLTFA